MECSLLSLQSPGQVQLGDPPEGGRADTGQSPGRAGPLASGQVVFRWEHWLPVWRGTGWRWPGLTAHRAASPWPGWSSTTGGPSPRQAAGQLGRLSLLLQVAAQLWGREKQEELLATTRVDWQLYMEEEEGVTQLLTNIIRSRNLYKLFHSP